MNQITPEALEFLEEAKKGFDNIETITYISKDQDYIALRTGFSEDCLSIYELGNEVGLFTEQLPKQQTVIVEYDELERYKKIEKKLNKLHSDLIQTKILGEQDNINIDYVLTAIVSDNY